MFSSLFLFITNMDWGFRMDTYLRVLEEVARRYGLTMVIKDEGWFVTFIDRFGNEFDMIFFDMGLNTSLVSLKVADKSRCYDILKTRGIPAVPHYFYMPSNETYEYKSFEQTLCELEDALDRLNKIVIKPNSGSSGKGIHFVEDVETLRACVVDMFSHDTSIAISPYIDFDVEYRVVVLDGEVMFSFGKRKGADGLHNLSAGACVEDVSPSIMIDLHDIAVRAADSVGARFVTVDVVLKDNELMVLEINNKVTLKRVAETNDYWFNKCVDTYGCAVRKLIEGSNMCIN